MIERRRDLNTFNFMTFTEIRSEVDALSTDDQDRLAAYLALRQNERDQDWCETISRRLDNKDPSAWVSLDELESNDQ